VRGRHAPARLVLAATLALTLGTTAAGRDASFAQMRDLLGRGYYNSAAQLNGPNLVRDFPDDPEAHLLYATALYLIGDLAAATSALEAASARTEGVAGPSHLHLGALIRSARGDAAGALPALREAFEAAPSYAFAMDWARVAWQAGEYEDALAAFTAAATTDRGRVEAWPHLGRGRILAALGRTTEAIAAFESAIDVFEANDPGGPRLPSPVYVEAWFRLGEAYESIGQLPRAEVSYKAARSADPNYGPAAEALDRLTRR
jgi:tetratricopeptide (TPR) repeat protein